MYVKVFEDGFVAYLWITLGYRWQAPKEKRTGHITK